MSHPPGKAPTGRELAILSLTALGVVYGDIGTSPLYALKECFDGPFSVPLTPENVLGVLSLVFWSLNFVVSYKYVVHMLRADNRGEGGILALMALAGSKATGRGGAALLAIGLFGSALLYGDGVITPAISVLGAVEGLAHAEPGLKPWVMWISIAIIVALFSMQKRGTTAVGSIFGPVTMIWFVCITLLGLGGIAGNPAVLKAMSPWHAVEFFGRHGIAGLVVLGSVVLVVTGGEALYADMGHFGKRPIRVAWFGMVLPALVLNYFGQGALLLRDPAALENPFYSLVPDWALYPMVLIATGAAITASQALISGAFSLTQQAVQLGYSPRVTIIHTSKKQHGQIYIPEVNQGLAVACVALVLGFQSAANLAGAYGVAVTGTMTVTTVIFAFVARTRWEWPWWKVLLTTAPLLAVDVAFAGANLLKITHGGWFPLAVAGLVFTLMSTWKRGRALVSRKLSDGTLPIGLFLQDLERRSPPRVSGTAVFMTSDSSGAPPVLLHHLKHNKVLHDRVVLLTIQTLEIPTVEDDQKVEVHSLGQGFHTVMARYGFMETPEVQEILDLMKARGLELRTVETSFYLGRETVLATGKEKLARWRKKLFIVMARNARPATAYFGLPANRVVELGAQIQL
ncbi:MAG TPA: potassium transporter Kup [Gemmatimonadales bacterium]